MYQNISRYSVSARINGVWISVGDDLGPKQANNIIDLWEAKGALVKCKRIGMGNLVYETATY